METVKDILAGKGSEVIGVGPDATLYEALEVMADRNVGAVLVIDEKSEVAGIFSERDFARKIIIKGRSGETTKVKEIMTRHVLYVQPDTTISECMALMTEKRVRHLPVLEREARRSRVHRRCGQGAPQNAGVGHFPAGFRNRSARALHFEEPLTEALRSHGALGLQLRGIYDVPDLSDALPGHIARFFVSEPVVERPTAEGALPGAVVPGDRAEILGAQGRGDGYRRCEERGPGFRAVAVADALSAGILRENIEGHARTVGEDAASVGRGFDQNRVRRLSPREGREKAYKQRENQGPHTCSPHGNLHSTKSRSVEFTARRRFILLILPY